MCQNCDPAPGPHPKNTSSTEENCSGRVCQNECEDSREAHRSPEPQKAKAEELAQKQATR
jgi:hypothetical protein